MCAVCGASKLAYLVQIPATVINNHVENQQNGSYTSDDILKYAVDCVGVGKIHVTNVKNQEEA